MLHEVLLAGWGCPIGELFDLEKLAEQCRKLGRYRQVQPPMGTTIAIHTNQLQLLHNE
jgi:hypothetical protein